MTVADLVRERLPHAPQMGLYVVPDLPSGKVQRATSGYASDVRPDEILALYDATLIGTGGNGATFTADRLVFKNHAFQSVQTVRYKDLVGVETAHRWLGLGGKEVQLTVNRGRATFDLTMDFSGAPEAADYVAEVLHDVMIQGVDLDGEEGPAETDVEAVRRALDRLRSEQKLADGDYEQLLNVLDAPGG